MKFDSQEEFFEHVGDMFIEPKQFGECLWPVTVEELYQHFKARLIAELHVIPPSDQAGADI